MTKTTLRIEGSVETLIVFRAFIELQEASMDNRYQLVVYHYIVRIKILVGMEQPHGRGAAFRLNSF